MANTFIEAFIEKCLDFIAKPEDITHKNCVDVFLYLMGHYEHGHLVLFSISLIL